MATVTLTGFLARFGSLAVQGEVLCTGGLGFILQDPQAARSLNDLLNRRAGIELPEELTWVTEHRLEDSAGRPDLLGFSEADGRAAVGIEAKLFAPISSAQLEAYATYLHRSELSQPLLALLIPEQRRSQAERFLGLSGATWRATDRVTGTVVTWEEVFAALTEGTIDLLEANVVQLEGLYRGLSELEVAPIAQGDALRWREKAEDWWRLVDQATRILSLHQVRLNNEGDWGGDGYRLRYVCKKVHGTDVCYSVGVRDPIKGHTTPVWMRYHSNTGKVDRIRHLLDELAVRHEDSAGHVWIPVEVPIGASTQEMVESIVGQVRPAAEAIWADERIARA